MKEKPYQRISTALIQAFPGHHRSTALLAGMYWKVKLNLSLKGKLIYKKGDSFYETANGLHAVARNPDSIRPAKLLVFFIADQNMETSVPENH